MGYTVLRSDAATCQASILALWRRNLPEALAQRYAWLYTHGPASGWLTRAEDGGAVGSVGLMRRTLMMHGQRVSAGQAIDLNVDREHRTIGAALGLQRAVTATVNDRELRLIYAFPNRASELVLKRAGYRVVCSIQRWAKPLCSRSRVENWPGGKIVKTLAAGALDSVMRFGSAEAYVGRSPNMRVEVTDHFDERFDHLWQKASGQFPFVGERTGDYLSWRFGHSPHARHLAFCLVDAEGRLAAYLVYCREAGKVHVGDFLFDSPASLEVLLAEFIRFMRREKAESIVTVFVGPDEIGKRLAKLGFWKRPSDWNFLIYVDRSREPTHPDTLVDPAAWFMTRADIDTDL